MKVLHVIPSLSRRRGGPTTALLGLCPELGKIGIETTIITTDDDVDRRLQVPLMQPCVYEGCRVIFFPRRDGWSRLFRDFSYSPELREWLAEHLAEYDLLHVHALFSYAPSLAMQLARRAGAPYICRPLGLLGEWALKQKPLRKRAFIRLFDAENLNHAGAIEYGSPQEMREAAALELPAPGRMIPLGFQPVPEHPEARLELCARFSLPADKTIILFLSRVHPKKGLNLLVEACSRLPADSFRLLIAGSGEPADEAAIRKQVKALGLDGQVLWTGFLENADKTLALRGADLFVLPSLSESFGIAVAEAMSAGCGVIVSDQVPVSDWIAKAEAGWVTRTTVDSVHEALLEALNNPHETQIRAQRAVRVAQELAFSVLAPQVAALYRGVLERAATAPTPVLRALHVIPSLSREHGGPSVALPAMARSLADAGVFVDVATTDDDGVGKRLADVPHATPLKSEGYRVIYFPKQSEFYKFSLPLLRWLFRHVTDYDVVHVHAVFSFSTLAAAIACRWMQVPYIVRPLGVLNRWGMINRRRQLKAASFRLVDKPVLDRAAAIHYTAEDEKEDASRLGIRARARVIPLGFDLAAFSDLPPAAEFAEAFPASREKRIILYLSRLDPKKNIGSLIEAFASVPDNTVLVIAGSGDAEHVAELKQRAKGLNLSPRIIWTGHIEGRLKMAAFAAAAVYVLPSHTENFGIALLEAMASGRACISTPGVALAAESAKANAVLICDGTPAALASAIQRCLGDEKLRVDLGVRAAELVRERFSAPAVAQRLIALYRECRVT